MFCQRSSGGVGGDSEGLQAASDLLKIQISGENMRVIVLLCDGRGKSVRNEREQQGLTEVCSLAEQPPRAQIDLTRPLRGEPSDGEPNGNAHITFYPAGFRLTSLERDVSVKL